MQVKPGNQASLYMYTRNVIRLTETLIDTSKKLTDHKVYGNVSDPLLVH